MVARLHLHRRRPVAAERAAQRAGGETPTARRRSGRGLLAAGVAALRAAPPCVPSALPHASPLAGRLP